MQVLPLGDVALLVEVADYHQAHALYEDVRRDRLDGLVDLVPAARTLLLTFVDERTTAAAEAALTGRPVRTGNRAPGPLVEIPVVYDGADLATVAELTGLGVAEVIARHEASRCIVAFLGFAPGFAYLGGLDPALHVSRRRTPRTRVPAGSVALADEFTAVYPNESPGGWHLLGRTTLAMWDLDREPPALLAPGTRVRFSAVTP